MRDDGTTRGDTPGTSKHTRVSMDTLNGWYEQHRNSRYGSVTETPVSIVRNEFQGLEKVIEQLLTATGRFWPSYGPFVPTFCFSVEKTPKPLYFEWSL
jgi:hypothetical protein